MNYTYEEFKRAAKEFHDALPSMNLDELDNSWKCLGLMYLGMYEEMWIYSAAILIGMLGREYYDREQELLS